MEKMMIKKECERERDMVEKKDRENGGNRNRESLGEM